MTETRIAFSGLLVMVLVALFSFWMYVGDVEADVANLRLHVAEDYMKSRDIKDELKEIKVILTRIEKDIRDRQ